LVVSCARVKKGVRIVVQLLSIRFQHLYDLALTLADGPEGLVCLILVGEDHLLFDVGAPFDGIQFCIQCHLIGLNLMIFVLIQAILVHDVELHSVFYHNFLFLRSRLTRRFNFVHLLDRFE
jgi:hypothetical protein